MTYSKKMRGALRTLSLVTVVSIFAAHYQVLAEPPCGRDGRCPSVSAERLQQAYDSPVTTDEQRAMINSFINKYSTGTQTDWFLAADQYFKWRSHNTGTSNSFHAVSTAPASMAVGPSLSNASDTCLTASWCKDAEAETLRLAYQSIATTDDQRSQMQKFVKKHTNGDVIDWVAVGTEYFAWRSKDVKNIARPASSIFPAYKQVVHSPNIESNNKLVTTSSCLSLSSCMDQQAERLRLAYQSTATTQEQRDQMQNFIKKHSNGGSVNWSYAAEEYFAWRAKNIGYTPLPTATYTPPSVNYANSYSSSPSTGGYALQSSCESLGFVTGSAAFRDCENIIGLQSERAVLARRQYDMQMQLYRQQMALYEEQLKEIKRERNRRQGEVLLRMSQGLLNSRSPTFLGGLNDGLAAASGLSSPTPPPPPLPIDFTLRLPSGSRANCSYDPTFQDVRCR